MASEVKKTEDVKVEEVPMITHRQPYVDENGVLTFKVHGPMPVSEWAQYEKENGL